MDDYKNLRNWAISEGYDPGIDYDAPEPVLPDGYLSPHFRAAEFACNHCGQLHPSGLMPPTKLLNYLENIREHFGGAPVTIHSGYRCPTHNANVGGATHSRHMVGDAVDISIRDIAPSVVYKYADTLIGNDGGVGKYDTFTHIDVRGSRARW